MIDDGYKDYPTPPAPIAAQTEKCEIACSPCGVFCSLDKGHAGIKHRWKGDGHEWEGTSCKAEQVDAARCPKCGTDTFEVFYGSARCGHVDCRHRAPAIQFFRAASLKQETQPGQIDIRTCTEAEYQNRYGVMAPDLKDLRLASSPLETPAPGQIDIRTCTEAEYKNRYGVMAPGLGDLRAAFKPAETPAAVPNDLCSFCFGLGRSVVEGTNGTEPCCCTKMTPTPAPADTGAATTDFVVTAQASDQTMCSGLTATSGGAVPLHVAMNQCERMPKITISQGGTAQASGAIWLREKETIVTSLASTGDTPQPQEAKTMLYRVLAEIKNEAVQLVVRDLLFDLKSRSGYGLPVMECTLRELAHTWAAIVEGIDMRRAQISAGANECPEKAQKRREENLRNATLNYAQTPDAGEEKEK